MGHALVVVIVEPDTKIDAIEQRVHELMEPFGQDPEFGDQAALEIPCTCTAGESQPPRVDCPECGGLGEIILLFNPQETWDWYEVGGKWHGTIRAQPPDELPEQAATEDELKPNLTVVADIPPGFMAHAVLTPDGEWHGGDTVEEPDPSTWVGEQAAILQRYADHLAIAVDFHH
jgi:hypothetical protein